MQVQCRCRGSAKVQQRFSRGDEEVHQRQCRVESCRVAELHRCTGAE